jgi:CspA family cold shock protein
MPWLSLALASRLPFQNPLREKTALPSCKGGRAAIGIVRSRSQGYRGNVNAVEILGMARGTVKWFNSQKGYGFIQPQGGGGKDVFVHISTVEKAGLSGLNEGQIVEYDEVANKRKTSAENLKIQR